MTSLHSCIVLLLVSCVVPVLARAHEPPPVTIETFSSRIAETPGDARLYWKRGELQRLEGNLTAAASDLDRAARLDPSLHEVELSRASLLLAAGEPVRALDAVTTFLGHEPAHAGAIALRARVLAVTGEHRAAVAEVTRAIELYDPPRPELYLERAEWVAELGPTFSGEALAGLEEGLERLGPVITLELRAVELEVQRGLHDAALGRLDRLGAQFDRKETIHARRGDVLVAAGRTLEAQVEYTEALDAVASLSPSRRASRSVRDLEDHVRSRLAVTPPNEEEAPQ